MKRLLLILSLLVCINCGIEPDKFSTSESALTTVRLGTASDYQSTILHPSVQFAYQFLTLPLAPYQPSTSSAFSEDFRIGYEGAGTKINTLRFHVWRVNATPSYPAYYVASADLTWDDGAGNSIPTVGYVLATAWPTDSFTMVWVSGNISITVKDRFGNLTWNSNYNWSFPYGNQPNVGYSPTVTFSLSSATNCTHDLPEFDDDVTYNGHMSTTIKYGTDSAHYLYKLSSYPTSQTTCSTQATNAGTSVAYQWHTGL